MKQDAETYLHDNDLAVVGLFPEGSEKVEKYSASIRKNISRGSRKIIELFSGKLMMLGLVEHQIISTEPLCIP